MYNSLKLFKCVDCSSLKNKSYEEVVSIYRGTKDKRLRNKCFCYIFIDLFPLIMKAFNTYETIYGISIEEKISLCIMRVFNSMDNYNTNNKTKFTSYLYGNIARGIMTLNKEYETKKRKSWIKTIYNKSDSNNDVVMDTLKFKEVDEKKYIDMDNNLDMFIEQLDSSILNAEEVKYCKALLSGYKKSDEFCDLLNYESETKFDSKKNDYVTVPTDNAKTRLNNLKRSIKNKIRDNGFSIF